MNVILVGTGNVAFVLAKLLVAAKHSVTEVVGRNDEKLYQIAQITGAQIKYNFSDINTSADVCLLAVSDNAIADVAGQLPLSDMLVAHTSGATPKKVLQRFANFGVLYPLQSLRKEMSELPQIPFFVDGNREENSSLLKNLALSTGNRVTIAGDEQRLKLHIAAVFSSNFVNHLYTLTETFCKAEGIDFTNVLPLILETAERLRHLPPSRLQTGPAVRNDSQTIQRHLDTIDQYPQLYNIYEQFTQSIREFYIENGNR